MKMKNPIHPGEILKVMYLEPLELTVTAAAKALGVTRKSLSELINGRAGISTVMALRLSKALDTSPEYWLNMQQNFDLWKTQRQVKLKGVEVLVNHPVMA